MATRRLAFSLAEVLLAMGTIVLVILTVLALVISLNRGSRKSIDSSAAQFAVDQIINLVVEAAQRDNGALHANFWNSDYAPPGSAFASGSIVANQTEFFYRVDATTVRDSLNNPLDGTNLPNNRLKLVTVELNWWNPAGVTTNRSGYGKLSTKVTRLIREKKPN